MEKTIAEILPGFKIPGERFVVSFRRFFPKTQTSEVNALNEMQEMKKTQPDLWKSLNKFADSEPDPYFFRIGWLMGYASLSEKQQAVRLTKEELKASYKEPIDLKDLEDELNQDSKVFVTNMGYVQKILNSDEKNPKLGDAFRKGFMLAILPFFRRY